MVRVRKSGDRNAGFRRHIDVTRRDGRRLFCLGFGYSAQALARYLPVADWHIGGTARDQDKVDQLRAQSIDAVLWEGADADAAALQKLSDATHVLVSTPPGDDGDPAFKAMAETIVKSQNLQWLGYLSTTGVYGNTDGKPVDETAATAPSGERGAKRVAAEAEWLSLFKDHGTPVHVFRLAGIYGPGRSVFDKIRKRQAKRIHKPGHVFSRIHVDDIARVLAASIAKPQPGEIYNVCDNEPAPPAEVTEYACHLLGVEPPEPVDFETAKMRMTPMGLSFWTDNRRVQNAKILNSLGVKLRYPDYRSGLQAVLAEET